MRFLDGKLIYLRPLLREDINQKYLSWVNDSEVTKYMEVGTFPTTLESLNTYYDKMTKSSNQIILAIIVKSEQDLDMHIGNVTLNNINWVHRNAELGIMIGDSEYQNKECNAETIKLMVNYAFGKLNLHKIWTSVHSENRKAIDVYSGLGFIIEATLLQEFYLDGCYYNRTILGIISH